jgi:two-component system NtrC family sensor kinase
MNTNRRILVIDDHRAIHEDFRKILAPPARASAEFHDLESELFDEADSAPGPTLFELTSAYQGKEGCDLAQTAEDEGRPFALAFVDVRMPPGWDGVETIARLWEISPRLQVVICTAYSDYSRDEIIARLGKSDRLLILRKPFDPVEIQRLACELVEKWEKSA